MPGSVSAGKPYFSRLSFFGSVVGGACLSALSLVLNPRLWPCRSSGGLNSNTLVTLPAQRTECLDKGHIFYQRGISCKWSIKFVVGRGKYRDLHPQTWLSPALRTTLDVKTKPTSYFLSCSRKPIFNSYLVEENIISVFKLSKKRSEVAFQLQGLPNYTLVNPLLS